MVDGEAVWGADVGRDDTLHVLSLQRRPLDRRGTVVPVGPENLPVNGKVTL